ncbi:MAG: VWA domain-containing protein [Lachnospiraceae bacterium]|nr:VWA domain-containing protein [Lachnospiraceae bacterium]
MKEWLVLIEAMEKRLHRNSLGGFYRLCRAIVLKDETEFDMFDEAFYIFFKDILSQEKIPKELLEWMDEETLRKDDPLVELENARGLRSTQINNGEDAALKSAMQRAPIDPTFMTGENHDGGGAGRSDIAGGQMPGGGAAGGRTAIYAAGSRTFRDFRKDNTLDTRQFQMAFRLLRNLSEQNDSNELEFDIDRTIHDTCDKGGLLQIRYKKPRKNTMKVIMLMDSGGSMAGYATLCSHLFQAAVASRHLKELKTYYFHNIVSSALYTDPTLERIPGTGVELDWIIKNCDSSYRVIIIGDAEMSPSEYNGAEYNWIGKKPGSSGETNLQLLKKHYPHLIWLNPLPMPHWVDSWTQTHLAIAELIDMYELTLDGLEKGFKFLLTGKKQ